MFTDELFIEGAPQLGAFTPMDPLPGGRLLVIVMTRWSPGFTCSVGFWRPLGVMKQKSSRPAESKMCWYEKLTVRNPPQLKSEGGLATTLPAAGRGHGSATGATG